MRIQPDPDPKHWFSVGLFLLIFASLSFRSMAFFYKLPKSSFFFRWSSRPKNMFESQGADLVHHFVKWGGTSFVTFNSLMSTYYMDPLIGCVPVRFSKFFWGRKGPPQRDPVQSILHPLRSNSYFITLFIYWYLVPFYDGSLHRFIFHFFPELELADIAVLFFLGGGGVSWICHPE